jgi:hypothetical protein
LIVAFVAASQNELILIVAFDLFEDILMLRSSSLFVVDFYKQRFVVVLVLVVAIM